MKKIYYILILLFTSFSQLVFSQSSNCSTATPICSESGVTYPALINNGQAPSGPNYGCLGSTINASYFTITVGISGDIVLSISNSPKNRDIDWVLWGAFNDSNAAVSSCATLGQGGSSGSVIACDYGSSPSGTITVNGAVAGKVYVLMVTNFSDKDTDISITEGSGGGSLCCPTAVTMPQTVLCQGQTMTLAPSTGGTWTSSNNSVATITNSGVVTAISGGTAYFTYTNSGGCTTSTQTFTVNALPTISGTSTVCIGLTTALSGSGTPDATTPWSSATTSVATVSNTGVVTGVAAGTSVITYKNNNGCTQTVTVTVNGLPTISGTPTVCVGLTTALTGSGTPDATTPWSSATTSVATVSNTGVVTGVAAGTSVITYKNNNGCTRTVTVTVNGLPTISGTPAVCVGLTTALTGSGTPDATTPWSSATTSVATVSNTGVVTGVAAGTSVITYKNNNGCTRTVTVTVNGLPTISGTPTVCVGLTTALSGSGTPDATTPWSSATTSVATVSNIGVVTGVAAGTSVITYKNNNGCTQTVTVTVNGLQTISGTPTVCVGLTTTLSGSGTPDATTPWSSATTSVATVSNTGVVTGVAAGTSVITYKNNSGCTQTVTVTVNGLPTISGTPTVCVGLTTALSGSGTPNATTPWSSATTSVATVSNTGVVTGVAAGTSVITYKNNNGCTQTATITVNPLPTASISGTVAVCKDGTAPNVTFTGAAGTSPYTFTYNVNGGANTTVTTTIGNSVTVAAPTTAAGTFAYNLVSVQDASYTTCTQAQTGTATITVNPLPTASISGTLSACLTTTLTAVTDAVSPTYIWYKDDVVIGGQTASTLVVTADGDYKVKITNTLTGCEQTSAASTVKVEDKIAPTGTAPAGISLINACYVDATTVPTGVPAFDATTSIVGYADNCGGAVVATLMNTVVTGDNCSWSAVYTFKVSDPSGNELTGQTITHTGGDTTSPVITLAGATA
ncbi:beta strand repeat-containing protein, partial [Flavobacterium rhamnosiphilum]